MLPPFMRGYQPDAIAVRSDRKIVIEVKSNSDKAQPQIEKLQAMFSAQTDWELRVVYAPAENAEQTVAVISRERVAENVDRLLDIFDAFGAIPALLTGWSVFEAAARSSIPKALGRPQTHGRLLEVLAADGSITPEEADALRKLGSLRNKAAHGDLDVAVTREQMAELVSVARSVLDLSTVGN
jgi:hypothetical protein